MAHFEDGLFIFRRLRRSKAFVLVTLATLAISLGACATMFTLVNAFLLSSLPYPAADQLAMVWHLKQEVDSDGPGETVPLSPGVFAELREQREIDQLAGFFSESVTTMDLGDARRLHALFVAGDFFALLPPNPVLGRALRADDGEPDAPPVVAISHALWQRDFAGAPDVVGRTLSFGGAIREIAGVLPADFRFSESLVASDPRLSKPVDLWVPYSLGKQADVRGFHFVTAFGRLADGTSLNAAQHAMRAYTTRAAERFPDTDRGWAIQLVPLDQQIFGRLRPVLSSLLAATGLLVLIACVNLATLLLARAQARRSETAVRLALGASRKRVVAESLTESLGLALAGGVLALGVAWIATRLLPILSPVRAFDSYPPSVDLRVALFTLSLALIAGLLFGTVPALRASRTEPGESLVDSGSRLTPRSRLAYLALVTAQTALATTLLVGMGLSIKNFRTLLHADLGLQTHGVVTFDVHLPRSPYRETERKVAFFRDLVAGLSTLPGVEGVAMNYALPLGGADPSNGLKIEGRSAEANRDQSANLGLVNPAYFETLAIPVLQGRPFRASDHDGAARVAVIDERLAARYFPGESPLGQRLSIASDEFLTIVGVVGAVQQDAFGGQSRPSVYVPYMQRSYLFTRFAIRTRLADPEQLVPGVRAVLRDLDPAIPASNISTLEQSHRDALASERFSLVLISVFAGVSLFLAQVGIFGVMSFLTRHRRREAGIRLAVGAKPREIIRLVLAQGLTSSVAGVVLGFVLTFAAGNVIASLAHGVATRDPAVFALVASLTLSAALLAYLPSALSLSRVDPSHGLR